jgi:hypothetical protein
MGRRTKGDNLMADVTTPFGFPYPEDTDLVRDGASDIENLAEGVNDYLTGGYLYAGTRYYTSSGQFEKADPLGTGDIGLRAIRVRMVGGGSAGSVAGNRSQGAGAGGGAGGYAESFITDISSLSTTAAVTVGLGGGGLTVTGTNTNGPGGGASSFDGTVVVAGGAPGGTNPAGIGYSLGGVGTTGDLVAVGGDGIPGSGVSDNGGGAGGASWFGGGGAGGRFTLSGSENGRDGRAFGAGGGGGYNTTTSDAVSSGSGADGAVIIDCFV